MGDATSTRQLTAWMEDFAASLDRRDVAAAVAMFDDDSYWRDLLPFTWNIKTLEGKGSIAAMLDATLHEAKPGNWLIEGDASVSDGVTEGWFTFETEAARGKGHIRLKGGKCWTLLTTMTDLKGFEEKTGVTRDKGVEHGVIKERRTWLERKTLEEAERAHILATLKKTRWVMSGPRGAANRLGVKRSSLQHRLKKLGIERPVEDDEATHRDH